MHEISSSLAFPFYIHIIMFIHIFKWIIHMNAGTIILIEPHERVNQANDSPQEDPPTNTSRVGDPDESSRHSLDTTTSSVPPLPSPIKPLNQEGASNDNSHLIESHESFDTLSLEIEVQNLIDRVTALESGHADVLQAQKTILQKQEDILSRLTAIENRLNPHPYQQNYHHNHHSTYTPQPPKHAPPTNSSMHNDFSFNESCAFPPSSPPPYIPPPPRHSPSHVVSRADETSRANENFHGACSTGGVAHLRIPFQQVQPHITSHIAHQRKKKTGGALPSSIIKKDKLVPASHIFQKYPKLLCESRIGTLAVKLAKDAYFGKDVMVQCTVAGERDLPGLPLDELHQLKQALYMQFHQFWQSPQEFEPLWKTATGAIGQSCKRLRSK